MTETNLTKKQLPKKIQKQLTKHNINVNVGDCFISNNNDILRISEIDNKGIHTEHQWTSGKWSSYGTTEFEMWNKKNHIKINKPIKELEKDIFKEVMELDVTKEKEPELSNETAIVVAKDTKSKLIQMKSMIEERKRKFQLMERILDRKRSQLMHLASNLSTKISKIMKIVGQIELYLGINEDILQLQEGEKANINTPLSLRQQIQYMDEEYGAIENGGLDFQNITEFDEWLLKDKHYENIIPEKKSVVVLRVRRNPKDYKTNNPFQEALLNQANYFTYLLIRNGENLYRIYAQIIIKPRLFPQKKEIQKMYEDGQKELWGFDKDDLEKKIFSYQQNLLLLQGLIDRTDILYPFPHEIQLFKPETCEKIVNFIYDDELTLSEGKQYYKDWHKEINSKIERGTRIYFCGFNRSERYDDNNRYRGNTRLRYPHLDDPKPGIYSVTRLGNEKLYEHVQKDENTIICHYLPKEKAHDGWDYWNDHDRRNRAYFKLLRQDWFVLNYDLMSLDDVEYYINNRYDRQNYLEMLPVLYEIKKERLKEIAWEKEFVKAMSNEFNCDEKIIWKHVEWWKRKVIWKRPIREDDSKAWRMIKSKIKRELKRK